VQLPKRNLLVQLPKRKLLFIADTTGRDDDEVAVARSVATAERERAREVDPDKARVQDRSDAAYEVGQEAVQLGKRRRARGAQPAPPAVAHTARFADRGGDRGLA
jgi:hypothetical protein